MRLLARQFLYNCGHGTDFHSLPRGAYVFLELNREWWMAKICLWTFHWDTYGSMHFRFHKVRRTSYRLTTEIVAESSRRCPPARSSRSRASRTETVGESSQRSSTPQPEPQMFIPRPPSVNLPPYHFDPYAHGSSSSYVDHGMPHPQMYRHCLNTCLVHILLLLILTIMPYSGDPSFMNLLTMSQPHVPFPQPHTGSQYFGMVPPPIFGSISSRGESSEAPEETHQSSRRDSMQDQLPQQPQPDVQTHRLTRQRVRPVCITEQQRQRNRRNRPA
ncbi:hypothetical protein Syun_014343 [Stephania yunnanensis]|uniref:Uncharacterized protein n=1 Tax=Stephania yunnanensis TaxID=152371 RepID=A0AAP0JJ56_9MAGN